MKKVIRFAVPVQSPVRGRCRVLRGGRSANRATNRYRVFGFRILRTPKREG